MPLLASWTLPLPPAPRSRPPSHDARRLLSTRASVRPSEVRALELVYRTLPLSTTDQDEHILTVYTRRYDAAEVLPAHEYRFRGLAHRVHVLLEHHERRCAEILHVIERRGVSTVWEIAGELTWSRGWSHVTGFMRRAAVAETAAHLPYLKESGQLLAMSSHPLDVEAWDRT